MEDDGDGGGDDVDDGSFGSRLLLPRFHITPSHSDDRHRYGEGISSSRTCVGVRGSAMSSALSPDKRAFTPRDRV